MANYINLTTTLIYPSQKHVHREWVLSANTNFLYKHVLSRGARLGLAAASIPVCALDIIIGLGGAAATVATLGMHRRTSLFAGNHLNCSNRLLSNLFLNLLKVINPTAPVMQPLPNQTPGLFAPPVRVILINEADRFRDSNNLLTRHVASRLTYALTALALIVVRVADAIIGMIALPLSFITFGLIEEVNSAACYGLQAPGVVNDLFVFTMRTINPWTHIVP